MVARRERTHVAGTRRISTSAFLRWRALLSSGRSVAAWFGRAIGTVLAAPSASSPLGETASPGAVPYLYVLGLCALSMGAAGSLAAVGSDAHKSASVFLMVLWSLTRWVFMRLAAEQQGVASDGAISRAWAIGLLPYAVAWTPWLHALAWTTSMAAAAIVLSRAGMRTRLLVWVVGWGYGPQLAALLMGWLSKNVFTATLSIGAGG